MLIIQIVLILFFILAIISTIFRFRSGQVSRGRLLILCLFWLLAVVVVIIPNSTNYLAGLVGIGRGADLIIYLSLALLFFINFNFFVKLEKANREITELTRALALKDSNQK